MGRRISASLLLSLTAVAGLLVLSGERDRPHVDLDDLDVEAAANLRPFDDCAELLDYFRAEALEMGPEGLMGGVVAGVVAGDVALDALPLAGRAEALAAGSATGGPEGEAGFSTTNVQEVGVDEADLVKTDGRLVVAVAGGRLHVVSAPDVRALGSVDLPDAWSHELLLFGDRVLVLARTWRAGPVPSGAGAIAGDVAIEPMAGAPVTVLVAVDVSDPGRPRVVETRELEGEYVAARLVGDAARLVLRSQPHVPQPLVVPEPNAIRARVRFREAVEAATLEDWLPEDGLDCRRVSRPPEPSGLGTVSVVTVAADGPLEPRDTVAVVADAETVYASATGLYVATTRWVDAEARAEIGPGPGDVTTVIHKFDISDPARSVYRASGPVRGHLLNQWSLSEHDGYLRVATTDGPSWWGPEASTESFLTVMAEDDEHLVPVGQVGGLGRGERIYAVRYVGRLAFVVTFRQTDPLYAVDLSEPTEPRVLGELKIPGFSAYLHPVGDGLLLGVGQDADEEGRVQGTQVSLFDVSDLARPERMHQARIDGSHSAVEYDHRAFLWWAPEGIAVFPVEVWGPVVIDDTTDSPYPSQPFNGAVAFAVGRDGIRELGRVSHAGQASSAGAGSGAPEPISWTPPVTRALVVGDTLFTLSEAGLLASAVADLSDLAWVPFAG